ncbi:hypothetical protein McanCB56680_000116 [Microsporum canis]|uniref:Uncharacterized protein n=1 Tax=Arthroderma otae (strain ATCC MYA-4605 / CBS 113480) TaxID=554155 RepID=C5FZ09_ARTOC|nr:uncharacterized protein MCYG_07576 [Microsporum canis CBS 113480]EEQ34757.1 predicted protein [Microsporum canis CBS 113480]
MYPPSPPSSLYSFGDASIEVQYGSPPPNPQDLQVDTTRDDQSQAEISEAEAMGDEESRLFAIDPFEGTALESAHNVLQEHDNERISPGPDSSDQTAPPRKRQRCDADSSCPPILPFPATHGIGGQAAASDHEQKPKHGLDEEDKVEAEGDETADKVPQN